jgi:thioredoxin
MLLNQGPAAPAQGDNLVGDTTTATFLKDVIEESRTRPVLVDFWAPWCGPCKQLTPTLEKVARAAKGKIKLVKMNIDDHPEVAQQLGIQSIPAVFAFRLPRSVLWKVVIYEGDRFVRTDKDNLIISVAEKLAEELNYQFSSKKRGKGFK